MGDNIIDGRGGADTMVGRGGNDWYFVDNAGDDITEAAGEGTFDRVFTSVDYALAAGVEVEGLATTDHFGTAAIDLTGNGFANLIHGNMGDNIIDGRGGADTMVGRGGNDWYFVDSAGDDITEAAGEGTFDRIFTSVELRACGWSRGRRACNDRSFRHGSDRPDRQRIANLIHGNMGDNIIDGRGGTDTMVGRGGNDWYFVDSAGDDITEAAGEGTFDRVFTSVDYDACGWSQVEGLATTDHFGTAAINLTGNAIANLIHGNMGDNIIDGRGGADTMVGRGGNN